MAARLQDQKEEQVARKAGCGVRDRVVDDPGRASRPAEEPRQEVRLDSNRVQRQATADLTGLRAPEVEGIEARADLLLVGAAAIREPCDAADLRGSGATSPTVLSSHGR